MTTPEPLLVGVQARRPVLLWRGAISPGDDGPATVEGRFIASGWQGAWCDGIFAWHHHHAEAHEVLGIARGWVRVTLGGEDGTEVTLHTGDVVLLPAGTAHRNDAQSDDLVVVGAYPPGQRPDTWARASPTTTCWRASPPCPPRIATPSPATRSPAGIDTGFG